MSRAGEILRLLDVSEGIFDPAIFKAVFLAGGPGSGKSYVTAHTTEGHGFRVVNSDTLLEKMMKDAKLSLDMSKLSPVGAKKIDLVRSKAKELTQKKLNILLKGRIGLVIDGTGKNVAKISSQKKMLEEVGYDAFMIFVNTSLDTALERNKLRARVVPDELVKSAWSEVQANIGKFNSLFGKNFVVVDNNGANDDIMGMVWKRVMLFSKEPIRNKVAHQWITDIAKQRGINPKTIKNLR